MATGIVSYGAYIPVYRLSRDTLGRVWGSASKTGERSVANWDEDSLTMAVEACTDCLVGIRRESVDGLYLGTTSPVYREKQSASIIAKACDLRRELVTADFTNSLRGGSSAVRAALDAVNAGSAKRFLVVASECQVPPPDSEFENAFGDGAAALLLGDSDVAVEIEGSHSISSDFIDMWKTDADAYLQKWEDRFIIDHGYLAHLQEVVSSILNKYGVTPQSFNKVVFYPYDDRRHAEAAKRLGFTPNQVQDPLLSTVGNTRAASAFMILVAALEEAKPGERILFVNYGDGADALMLKVTDRIGKLNGRRGVRRHLAAKMMLPSYGKYIHFKNLMEWQNNRSPREYGSLPMSWRDKDWMISCTGQKCRQCGGLQFPKQRVCTWCQAKDDFDNVNLADKKGTLFTFSLDNLTTITPDPPNVLAVVDLDGGGRLCTTMTDRDPEKLSLNMPVELTFRRVHDGQGYHNYFWKCRPIRI